MLQTELPIGLLVVALFPTWIFGWLVMGRPALANVIVALIVLGNVLLFAGIGVVFVKLRHRDRVSRWITTVLVYVGAAAAITLIGLSEV